MYNKLPYEVLQIKEDKPFKNKLKDFQTQNIHYSLDKFVN